MHGYADVSPLLPDAPDATRFDVTAFSPSEAGASGALVTTAADVTRFYRALLQGHLLPPGLLRRMLTDTVPTVGAAAPPAVAYGLGVYVYATECGHAYGHGGSAPGYLTFALNSRDGRDQLLAHTNWNSSSTPRSTRTSGLPFSRVTAAPHDDLRGPVRPGQVTHRSDRDFLSRRQGGRPPGPCVVASGGGDHLLLRAQCPVGRDTTLPGLLAAGGFPNPGA